MADETVYVIDQIVTKAGQGSAFLDSYLERYAPGALQRGMTLEHALVSPPVWLDHEPNTVLVIWSVRGPAGWWGMSVLSRYDEAVTDWWQEVDATVVSRQRSFFADLSNLRRLENV